MARGINTPATRTLALVAALLGTTLIALTLRRNSERCAEGWNAEETRCCPRGQVERAGHCQGVPEECPAPLVLRTASCLAEGEPILLPGGTFELGPSDWDAGHNVQTSFKVAAFRLDPFEVTRARYAECERKGVCPALGRVDEPGRPVTEISALDAEKFCAFHAGRLPTELEWIYAASSGGRFRYPWGPHGLVCRRAVFGMVSGPCAYGGRGPEQSGSRPAGKTKTGLYDLAGNVAEWTVQSEGRFVALGGSFRSSLASSLKSWNVRTVSQQTADDIGFRCAYPLR